MPQARRPPPPGAQPLTCRCRRRRSSTFLQGGAPTRPGCGPLYSPPGQARGGAGASPERRNPPPGWPPPAPGSTRGRAGEGGRGEQTVGEEGEGTRKVGVPAAPGAPPPPISGRTGGQGLTRGPRVGGGGRRLAWREGGRSRRTDSDARGGRAAQRSAPAGVPEPPLPSLYNRPPPHGSSPGQGGWAGALGYGPALEGPRRRGRALPGFASRNPAPA
nr:PREDICTED: uncharacterized protein LOC109448006 [Rhinolophus sinicus]